jgi:hypothetical protein
MVVTSRLVKQVTLGAVGCLIVAATPGCGVIDGLRGQDRREHGQLAVAVDLGDSAPAARGALDDVVEDAAGRGAAIRVWVLDSASAASMEEVVFGDEAGGGDFKGTANNDPGREAQSDALAAAARAELSAHLDGIEPADGADLLGALERVIVEAANMDREGEREAVLLTGGGVQRTSSLDLFGDVGPEEWDPAIAGLVARLPSEEVKVTIVGVANFEGVSPPPADAFVNRVEAFWGSVCDSLKAGGRSCQVLPSAPRS